MNDGYHHLHHAVSSMLRLLTLPASSTLPLLSEIQLREMTTKHNDLASKILSDSSVGLCNL